MPAPGGLSWQPPSTSGAGVPRWRAQRLEASPDRAGQSEAARRLLRELLSPEGDAAWPYGALESDPDGRPRLTDPGAPHVSLAHSGPWIACAASPSGAIGVDIETLRTRDWPAFGEMAFHPDEQRWVLAAHGTERDLRALSCWCRKEALAKALGCGLDALPLRRLAIDPAGALHADGADIAGTAPWNFHTEILEGAVLALAWQ